MCYIINISEFLKGERQCLTKYFKKYHSESIFCEQVRQRSTYDHPDHILAWARVAASGAGSLFHVF